VYLLFFRRPGKKLSTAHALQVQQAVKASHHPMGCMHLVTNLPSTHTQKKMEKVLLSAMQLLPFSKLNRPFSNEGKIYFKYLDSGHRKK
jgi:hypothetical protein